MLILIAHASDNRHPRSCCCCVVSLLCYDILVVFLVGCQITNGNVVRRYSTRHDMTAAAVAKADDPGRKERERAEAINYLQVWYSQYTSVDIFTGNWW